MKIYEMTCRDIKIRAEMELIFSEDKLPLDQNCDVVEIHKLFDTNYLRLFYDEGSCLAIYRPAFEFIYIDSQNERVDIYVSKQYLEGDCPKNDFEMICIHLKNSELLHRLKEVFKLDTMISLENWIE